MKTIKASGVTAGMLSAVALTIAAPAFSGTVGEDVLDIHGWRIDAGDKAEQVASSNSPYVGTSMKVGADNLGFTDPRPGQGDYQYSPDGEPGFTDPRPGE